MKRDNDKYFIFKHTNKTNGKIFVEGTLSGKNGKRDFSSNKVLSKDINIVGWKDGFTHELIVGNIEKNNVNKIVIAYIEKFNSWAPTGYNIKDSNYQTYISALKKDEEERTKKVKHKKHSKETIEKISRANKGKNTGNENHKSRTVAGMNIETGEISFYESASLAAKALGIFNNSHIIECCKGKRNSTAGYAWAYMSDLENKDIYSQVPVTGINETTGESIHFDNVKEAAEYFGAASQSNILKAINGQQRTSFGYFWVKDN